MILTQSHSQQQGLSAAMQQSLKILQLSWMSLQDYLTEAAISNPMIDIDNSLDNSDQELSSHLNDWRYDVAEEYTDYTNYTKNKRSDDNDEVSGDFADVNMIQETFVSYLKRQLPQLSKCLPEYYLPMCEFIIESLDRRGYLDEPMDLLAAAMNASIDDAMQALYAVQTLSPTGVGARTLEECLILQLAESAYFNRYTLRIIQEHLTLLSQNDILAISKRLKISSDEAQQYCDVIRQLNPIPSNGFPSSRDTNRHIVPDAVVEVTDREVIVHYNHQAMPKISINKEYQSLMSTTDDPEVREYLKQNYQQAQKLQQDLGRRESTLTRLIQYILTAQKDFVLGRCAAPRPLSVQEIAENLDLHQSTVSRGIKDKYVAISGRTLPLKSLLSTQVGKGVPISKAMLKVYFTRIIDAEDRMKPLSDAALCAALAAMNIQLSRRAVTAYREEFGFPVASKRKQHRSR